MRTVVVFSLFIYATANVAAAQCNDADDGYYWRDFKGEIPQDAVPGGTNAQGKKTYMGQVLHQNQVIPAKIDLDAEKTVTFEWGYSEYDTKKAVKILCSKHPEAFEWVDTGNREINKITNKNFVIAGYENEEITLLIGRKLLGNELVIGKIVFTKGQSTLNTTKDGTGTQHGEFQALAYDARKRKNPFCNLDSRGGASENTNQKNLKKIFITFYQ